MVVHPEAHRRVQRTRSGVLDDHLDVGARRTATVSPVQQPRAQPSRQALPTRQVKRGREAGSWDPGRGRAGAPDGYEWHTRYTPYGGRLYVTCLSIYMLEVYYRHLPIYTNVYAFTQGF